MGGKSLSEYSLYSSVVGETRSRTFRSFHFLSIPRAGAIVNTLLTKHATCGNLTMGANICARFQYTPAVSMSPLRQKRSTIWLLFRKRLLNFPSEGLHLAQITRVDDVGQVETSFGVKEKIRIIFTMLDEKTKDGTPLDAMISANKVLGEKSTLGKLLAELKIPSGGYVRHR